MYKRQVWSKTSFFSNGKPITPSPLSEFFTFLPLYTTSDHTPKSHKHPSLFWTLLSSTNLFANLHQNHTVLIAEGFLNTFKSGKASSPCSSSFWKSSKLFSCMNSPPNLGINSWGWGRGWDFDLNGMQFIDYSGRSRHLYNIMLSFSTQEHDILLHFFRSCFTSVSEVLLFSSCRLYAFLIKFIPGDSVMLLLLWIESFVSLYFPIGCFSCIEMALIFLYLMYILLPY